MAITTKQQRNSNFFLIALHLGINRTSKSALMQAEHLVHTNQCSHLDYLSRNSNWYN